MNEVIMNSDFYAKVVKMRDTQKKFYGLTKGTPEYWATYKYAKSLEHEVDKDIQRFEMERNQTKLNFDG